MMLRIYGAIFIVLGCGGISLMAVNCIKNEVSMIKQFISALEYMICDLEFRHTPLSELFRKASDICNGTLKKLFAEVAMRMELQQYPNAAECMKVAIANYTELPKQIRRELEHLSQSLGIFDLQGQIDSLEAVKGESLWLLKQYSQNLDVRLRSYRALGICLGAAIAILLI